MTNITKEELANVLENLILVIMDSMKDKPEILERQNNENDRKVLRNINQI